MKDSLKSVLKLSISSHGYGMISSSVQRGSSAYVMFYAQSKFTNITCGLTRRKEFDEGIAGFLSGVTSSPFHTYWELIKVTGKFPCSNSFLRSLKPMMFRHGVFDCIFFTVNKSLEGQHSSLRFAISAATASFVNLMFDVWKTRQMEQFPKKVDLTSILKSFTVRSYFSNYFIKGIDLSFNWFIVGILKEILYNYDKK